MQVGGQLLLGGGAAAADVSHALVVLEHDGKLLLVAGTQIRQDGWIPQVAHAALIRHKPLQPIGFIIHSQSW